METGGQEVQVQKRQKEGQKREGDEESYRHRSNLTNELCLESMADALWPALF